MAIKGIKIAVREINSVLSMRNVLVKVALMYNAEHKFVKTSSVMGVNNCVNPDFWSGWTLVQYYGCNTPELKHVSMKELTSDIDNAIAMEDAMQDIL